MVTLEYAGHTLIGFDDRSYRWILVKRFTCDRGASDEEILAALIGHRQYRDNFLSPDSHEKDTQTDHGPYRIAKIVTTSFESIEPGTAAAEVEEFCGLSDCLPRPDVGERIQALVMSPLQESVCFRLRELPQAIHEYGFVLMEFREIVVLDRNTGAVILVVMAID